MLTDYQLDVLQGPITDLFEEFQMSVIRDIARRLAGLHLASAAWQVQRLNEAGMIYENILKELEKLTGQSEQVLRATFEKAGVTSIRFDDKIYTAAGLNPRPLNLSPAMSEVLNAGLRKTANIMRNLVMTTAASGQEAFIGAADLAYMQVSTGAMSYTQAIKQAVKDVAANGLSVIQFSGRQDQIDVAIRRSVLTGVSQTVGEMQMARADEMGTDLVQTSAHAGSRPEHELWQGQVFSRSGTNPKYPDFVSSTGYGEVDGLMGINCRHSFYPFFEGISDAAYTEADLENLSNKTVNYNEKEISGYDASQIQRGLERQVRYWKRQSSALEAAGKDTLDEAAKVIDYQAKLRDFVKQTGIQRQRIREQI